MFKKSKPTVAPDSSVSQAIEAQSKGNNPYLNAREEWLERYGNYIKRAAQWRLFALICLVVACISVSANVMMANQFTVVPYLVEVDSLGRSVTVGRADVAMPAPVKLIQAELANYITSWRTVTADLDLQKKMISRLSFFTAGAAKGQLKEWFSAYNPYSKSKDGKLVQINVKGLPHSVSQDSWRIEWTENVRNHEGNLLETQDYEATLTIMAHAPTTEEEILKNPGGIFISNIAFSKILNPTTKSTK